MTDEVASIVVCDACGERVAEIIVDGDKALCSPCHLHGAPTDASRDNSEADRDD